MDLLPAALVLGATVLVGLLVYALAVASRRAFPRLDAFVGGLDDLRLALDRVGRQQEQIRIDVQQGREAALLGIADARQDLQGRLAVAQRALAEVKALEQARGSQLDRATDSLRRLEAVVAGSSSRGAAGENVLARALVQLPPDLLETGAAFEGSVVEYALRLPGGRLLPIDSKWTSAASLERLEETEDPAERRRLREQVARDVRMRIRDMTKYLDPERTLSLAVLAVPDAVHAAAPECHAEGWREGVLVVPYSLALPFVLSLYRLAVRFASAAGAVELSASLGHLAEALCRMDDAIEGRLSRALAQIGNARDDLRRDLARARQAAEHMARDVADGAARSTAAATSPQFDPPSGAG
jgi:DNA recombination protein RmuC